MVWILSWRKEYSTVFWTSSLRSGIVSPRGISVSSPATDSSSELSVAVLTAFFTDSIVPSGRPIARAISSRVASGPNTATAGIFRIFSIASSSSSSQILKSFLPPSDLVGFSGFIR
jgi:hypothetical protein